jgi:phosphocarrier protein FPr
MASAVVSVAPPADELQRALAERDLREQRLQAAWANRFEPAVTRDGHAVEVFANIGESNGIAKVVEQGAEGVGLLRTELIFMAHPQAPDVATQEAEYRRVLDGLAGGRWWCAPSMSAATNRCLTGRSPPKKTRSSACAAFA